MSAYTPADKTRLARRIVLATFGLLLLVLVLSGFSSVGGWFAVLLLLPFAYGVVRENWRAHIWLCFVLLFYFLLNINTLANNPGWLDYVEGCLIAMLFVAAMLYCRWSKQIPVVEPIVD